jgi:HAD superfamily hydrolase (TIGR01509 family)
MLKAIIFDFNGIILNDEPVHFRAMRDIVATFGIRLDAQEYWERYLPLDDENCFDGICAAHSVSVSRAERQQALRGKAELYQEFMRSEYPLFPGSADFVRLSAARYPLAIASGARREEVEDTLKATGLHGFFRVIVAAQDFTRGKPHPDSFLLALRRLNERLDGHSSPIVPPECLVVEDSVGGVRGARAAGMRCLAVSNTYPAGQLAAADADRVVSSLEGLSLVSLQDLFGDVS